MSDFDDRASIALGGSTWKICSDYRSMGTFDTNASQFRQGCFGHEYEQMESLPSGPDGYQELWTCIHCGHAKVMTHHVGVRD